MVAPSVLLLLLHRLNEGGGRLRSRKVVTTREFRFQVARILLRKRSQFGEVGVEEVVRVEFGFGSGRFRSCCRRASSRVQDLRDLRRLLNGVQPLVVHFRQGGDRSLVSCGTCSGLRVDGLSNIRWW
uniref:(northern house mosquito) hypothetical protein n=1 Tax=Culex pipiens TaxID=7175 RepID=A0A8D8NZ12_CULPI